MRAFILVVTATMNSKSSGVKICGFVGSLCYKFEYDNFALNELIRLIEFVSNSIIVLS